MVRYRRRIFALPLKPSARPAIAGFVLATSASHPAEGATSRGSVSTFSAIIGRKHAGFGSGARVRGFARVALRWSGACQLIYHPEPGRREVGP
jgi:hypothetical protein